MSISYCPCESNAPLGPLLKFVTVSVKGCDEIRYVLGRNYFEGGKI
jgi:hypothetical protein